MASVNSSTPSVPPGTSSSSVTPAIEKSQERSQAIAQGELRIALAMSGGIALTLYEAGVSHEVFRLFKAWQELTGEAPEPFDQDDPLLQSPGDGYREALEITRLEPIIDILTGASAGGINSVFLASCITSGRDFGAFHDIWIDTADIGNLQYQRQTEATSILNTQNLRNAMEQQLQINIRAAAQAKAQGQPVADVLVQLCRTETKGQCLSSVDAIGHKIDVEKRANVIEFRTEDFQQPANIQKLTAAALATSAFPALFPPVLDEQDKRWFVDGGLWNNQPIDLAVAAIREKPSVFRTHRCLMFVEPNPGFYPENSVPRVAPPAPSVAEILGGLPFMGLKGNIWPSLDSILDFNQRYALYRSLVSSPDIAPHLEQIGFTQYKQSRQQMEESNEWRETIQKPEADIFDIIQRSNLTWEFTALNTARFDNILLGDEAALGQMWHSLLEKTAKVSPQAVAMLRAWALSTLWLFAKRDLTRLYVRKRLREVNQELNVSHAPPTLEMGAQKAALYRKLDECKTGLDNPAYAEETKEWLTAMHDLFRADSKPTYAKLMEKLYDWSSQWHGAIASLVMKPPRDRNNRQQFLTLLEQPFRGQGTGELDQLLGHSIDALEDEIDHFFERLKSNQSQSDHALVANYLLGGISDLVGKGPLDLVRVSPNDTHNEDLAWPDGNTTAGNPATTAAQRKLAGEGLGHLTGFLENRWRRNDYIWGRLDTAEILLRTVQLYGEQQGCPLTEEQFQKCLSQAQDAILEQEAHLLNRRRSAAEKAAQPQWTEQCGSLTREDRMGKPWGESVVRAANRQLIGFGRETLQDASEPALSSNIDYLVSATIRLARGSSDKLPVQLSILERLFRLFSYLIILMTWVAPVSVHKQTTGRMLKWASVTLIFAALAGFVGFLCGGGTAFSAALSNVVMGLGAILLLVSSGALIGWRFWWVGLFLFLGGLLLGWKL